LLKEQADSLTLKMAERGNAICHMIQRETDARKAGECEAGDACKAVIALAQEFIDESRERLQVVESAVAGMPASIDEVREALSFFSSEMEKRLAGLSIKNITRYAKLHDSTRTTTNWLARQVIEATQGISQLQEQQDSLGKDVDNLGARGAETAKDVETLQANEVVSKVQLRSTIREVTQLQEQQASLGKDVDNLGARKDAEDPKSAKGKARSRGLPEHVEAGAPKENYKPHV